MNKRNFRNIAMITSKFLIAALLLTGCSSAGTSNNQPADNTNKSTTETKTTQTQMYTRSETVTIDQAKQLLVEGNKRYVDNKILGHDITNTRRKALSTNGQKPFAVILSCSDSRVPPELVFDQGLGDLFIVRNAGNVIDPIALGSIEYGAEHLGAPLIVVLGHEKCGAVKAAMEGGTYSDNITAIINQIKPSYDKVKANNKNADDMYNLTIDENVRNSMSLINKSTVIQKLLTEKKINIIGGKYHMDTGEVTFDIQ
ncbi:carbonic anhydrase [Clostridium manihotivorum]|uniref:carbonic anhydrase n=1 Tax=Clostridium manihotivorum TaxID=2320868 RepID=A0A410DN45_9CLOT|nr:carbonic anhydrase [Clostridium manihotivorum]QAA30494.1 carbonic anhydrase [Clostridium manihotivorum]